MKYGLFLGCNTPALRPDVERAIRLTMPALGVELVDLEGYVCCPAFGTFPSCDEDAHLAVNAWNLSLAEELGLDALVECGSCYSSLSMGRAHMLAHPEKKKRVDELLAIAGRAYRGEATPRHITDVLFNEVGLDKIGAALKQPLKGITAVVQYPCHTLYPSDVVGVDRPSGQPHMLRQLVEALGAEVKHYSREYQCCGGAGGFHGMAPAAAKAFTRCKLDAIKAETGADVIVVSCITCLMHLDNTQRDLTEKDGGDYAVPVLDYNQLLALAMGFDAAEVASIASVSRDRLLARLRQAA